MAGLDSPVAGDPSVVSMNETQLMDRGEPGWGPLAVLMGGIFLVVLDFFIVNVALPSLQHDLHATSSGI